MPVSGDVATPLIAAIVAIVSGDATMQTLCGRTTRLIVPFEDVNDAEDPATEIPLPVLVYTDVDDQEIGGLGDERLITLTFDAIAEGNDARQTVNEMTAQIRNLFTWTAFNAHGLDAIVRAPVNRSGASADPEATRGLVIKRSTYTIQVTAP